jgi:polysaccharide export outer membrane protein
VSCQIRCGRRAVALALVAVCAVSAGACATVEGPFVWADEWKEPPRPGGDEYIISPGDSLNVQVWDQDNLSTQVRVRSDGQVSLMLIGDVQAAGMSPIAFSRVVEDRLRGFIVAPQVTVAVEDVARLNVSVLGQVVQPGIHTLDVGSGVAQALAVAGGLRDFAHKDRIFLVRAGPITTTRIRMTYRSITAGAGRAALLKLRSGDILVVE